jgi:hypothetical protein
VLDLVWVDLTARGPAPIERVSVDVRDLMATVLGASQLRDRELEVDARLTPEFRAALAAPASPER